MNIFMYYFDKLTSWLDFSWLITIPRKETNIQNMNIQNMNSDQNNYPPPYEESFLEPLLRK